MAQAYSNPERENETYSLPDVEIWYHHPDGDSELEAGWYYWFCFPGCLPDSDPFGPFKTEAEALADAQNSD